MKRSVGNTILGKRLVEGDLNLIKDNELAVKVKDNKISLIEKLKGGGVVDRTNNTYLLVEVTQEIDRDDFMPGADNQQRLILHIDTDVVDVHIPIIIKLDATSWSECAVKKGNSYLWLVATVDRDTPYALGLSGETVLKGQLTNGEDHVYLVYNPNLTIGRDYDGFHTREIKEVTVLPKGTYNIIKGTAETLTIE